MKMQCSLLFVLAALPVATASKTDKDSSIHVHDALQHNIPVPTEKPEYGALKGSGGGLDTLWDMKDGTEPKYYRPWKTRYDLQPYDVNNPNFLKPENRMGYRHFYAANPHLSLEPNSRDREAESTVVMMFGMTALAAVVCGIAIVHGMQVLDIDNLDMQAYHKQMIRIIGLAALPWMLLGAWLFTVFVSNWASPSRESSAGNHWQCGLMNWFLLFAPLVNTLYFSVHALWISNLFFTIEKQPDGAMGRMFSPYAGKTSDINAALAFATGAPCRYTLFLLEVFCAVLGYLMVSFRGGANSQFCHPEVYWATAALVTTSVIIIVFASLSLAMVVILAVYTTSPWVQDFFGSFRENGLLKKMQKEEEVERDETAAWKAQRANDKYDPDEEAWDWHRQEREEFEASFEDDRLKHDALMAQHETYLESVSQPPPRNPNHPQLQQVPDVADDEPLVIWDEDSEPDTTDKRVVESSSMAGTPPVMTITSSMAVLNAQVDASPKQPWPSQGFETPFAQRPASAPVIPLSQPVMMTSGALPPSMTSIHAPPAAFTNSV